MLCRSCFNKLFWIQDADNGYKTKLWGIPLPHWGWKNPELNKLFTEIHEISAFCLILRLNNFCMSTVLQLSLGLLVHSPQRLQFHRTLFFTWNNEGSSIGGTSMTVSLGLHLGIPVQTDTASSEEQACSAPDTEGTGK